MTNSDPELILLILIVMAASFFPQAYQCQFIDNVPEDFYCMQCSLVARKLTITSCCGETYCNDCILSIQQDNKSCPNCGEEKFETFPHVKFQKKVLSLEAYCPMKEKGCGWSGRLEQLEGHLHPDEGDCEYTNVHCPLKCQQRISRKDLTDHTANKCIKRDYICPYCAFKATYEIVSTVHWPECSYYPLPCPNRCGVTCERQMMEDHIKICPLEVLNCTFEHVGCPGKFKREEEEEHMREKSQTHLIMMVTASVKMKEKLQNKIEEQEKKIKELEKGLQEMLSEFGALHMQLEKKSEDHLEIMQEKEQQLRTENMLQIERLEKIICGLYYKFTMENFSAEKAKDGWKSPAMYTHPRGYKFCVGIDANGCDETQGEYLNVELWAMEGDYDDQLKWPVTAKFTIELINHHPEGDNKKVITTATWNKPNSKCDRITDGGSFANFHFIKHSKLTYNTQTYYLKDDTLYFIITDITVFSIL